MHLEPEDQAFVDDARAFIAANLDPETRAVVAAGGHPDKAQVRAWEQTLATRNWLVYTWSRENGGPGLTTRQQILLEEIIAEMHAPVDHGLSTRMAGPVILAFGSPEQQARHLPGIRNGTVGWCQGYSEPGAGSDLASLSTRAALDGDDYVVNGQKIWTTHAHWADWMFMLVRTSRDSMRQSGITFLLMDMKTPGITIRPIVSADGHHSFNEVFFEDVRVPVANRIGEEGKGWTYAKYLLSHERLGVVSLPAIKYALTRAEEALERVSQRPSGVDPSLVRRLVDLKVRARALEAWVNRGLAEMLEGGRPGLEVSLMKIRGTELNQDLAEFTMDVIGLDALPSAFNARHESPDRDIDPSSGFCDGTTTNYIFRRAYTILGGSTEIQKNIVSKALLGL